MTGDLDRIPDWMQPDTTTGRLNLQTWAQEFQDVYRIAEALCKTSFVPKEMLGKQSEVTACIMKGRELGLDPFDALGSMYVVHGRVGLYADFMRRRIIQAGHSLRILENTDNRAVIEAVRKEGGEPHRASFTAEQARRAGIDLGKYPADKLIARATSRLCKQAFPDVLAGSLIIEDILDGVIPSAPAADEAPAPAIPAAPVQRTRKPRAAKAASTQPKPAPAAAEPDSDINELLDDQPPQTAPAGTEPIPNSPGRRPPPPDLAGSRAPTPGADLQDSNREKAPSDPASQTPDDDDVIDLTPEQLNTTTPLTFDDDPEPVRLITEPQLKKLSILLREAGFEDRDSRHDFVAAAIGRGITTAKELTLNEASRVIDILENEGPQDD